eukprot:gene11360-4528_t
MLIECNIPCDLTQDIPEEILNHLVNLKQLGYDGAVLNHIIEEKKLKDFKKIKQTSFDSNLFKNTRNKITPLRLKDDFEDDFQFKIYKRLTVKLSKGDTLAKLFTGPFYQQFDILAIEPLKLDNILFIVDKLNIDLISIPTGFVLSQVVNKIKEASRRGIQFEIMYGNTINSLPEFQKFGSLLKNYMRFLNSKSLIISNGTTDFSTYKSPQDVINM